MTLVATFFVGALLQMSPSRLRRTIQDEQHDNAAAAARAGVEYCLGQLAENKEWSGQGNGITVQTDNMVVCEDHGNVTGWMRTDNGEWAGFRMRFNYQDGDGGPDGMDQPAQLMPSTAISCNNLDNAGSTPLPLGTGPDHSYTNGPDQHGFSVPGNTVALVVEGMVGPGVGPDGALAPTLPVGSKGNPTVVRTIEGIYSISGFSRGMPDGAVLQAGGDTHFILGDGPTNADGEPDSMNGFLRLTASDQTAVMRTKGSSGIEQGPGKHSRYNFYPDMHADVRVGQPGFHPDTKAGQEFNQTTEAPNDALMEIEWNKVAESDQPDRLHLPAGVYAVSGGDTDSSDPSRLHYFPMTFSEYRAKLAKGETPESAPVPEGFASRVALNGRDWTAPDGTKEKRDLITFEKDIEVDAVKGSTDIAIIPVNGAKQKSVSDLTSTIPATDFPALLDDDKNVTGIAILDFLAAKTRQTQLTFNLDGTEYNYDSTDHTLAAGSPGDVAQAILKGGQLSFPGDITAKLPGTQTGELPGKTGFPIKSVTPGDTAVTVDVEEGADVLIQSPATGPGTGTGTINATLTGGSGFQVTDPNAFMAAVQRQTDALPESVFEKNVDPLRVPETASPDQTVPQDLEIAFAPAEGESAAIRTTGNVMLGTHLSGQGGAVVAAGRIDIIGLGIDLNAGNGERDGVSLYSKKDINISTYDQRRNKFWDASIKGVIFAKGNLTMRLGETLRANQGEEPAWGRFDYLGSAIVLGDAPAYTVPTAPEAMATGGNMTTGGSLDVAQLGNASFIASGIRLFYEPKFLAPYLEGRPVPIFSAVSVVER